MTTDQQPMRFYRLLELRLADVAQQLIFREVTENVLREVRDAIFTEIRDLFAKSNHRLSFEALSWLSDQYFKALKINNDVTVAELIVLNEYKLADMSFSDVQLLHQLYHGTRLGTELDVEYTRRLT
jgi:hypothetical protein